VGIVDLFRLGDMVVEANTELAEEIVARLG
jgi:hypothetical protein